MPGESAVRVTSEMQLYRAEATNMRIECVDSLLYSRYIDNSLTV